MSSCFCMMTSPIIFYKSTPENNAVFGVFFCRDLFVRSRRQGPFLLAANLFAQKETAGPSGDGKRQVCHVGKFC